MPISDRNSRGYLATGFVRMHNTNPSFAHQHPIPSHSICTPPQTPIGPPIRRRYFRFLAMKKTMSGTSAVLAPPKPMMASNARDRLQNRIPSPSKFHGSSEAGLFDRDLLAPGPTWFFALQWVLDLPSIGQNVTTYVNHPFLSPIFVAGLCPVYLLIHTITIQILLRRETSQRLKMCSINRSVEPRSRSIEFLLGGCMHGGIVWLADRR